MASYCTGGTIIMKPDDSVSRNEFEEYPFGIPKIILDGFYEYYCPPKDVFSWGEDSVIVIKENIVSKYNKILFTELLVKNKDGNTVWIDSRDVPFDGSFKYADIVDQRGAEEFTIEEYDLEKSEKKKYKVMLEETIPMEKWEIDEYSKKFI